ncbi:MAG: TonB-dependent receptor, partial [Planctomycetota bacterium]
HLRTFSRQVLALIEAGDSSWKDHVPAAVADVIEGRGLFGCEKREAVAPPIEYSNSDSGVAAPAL